jgi:phage terminase small subunit
VQEYLIDLNATQAAIRAGYSPRTANEQGARLLANVSIAQAISQGKQAQVERTGITADRVLNEIARLAFVDVRKLFAADGGLKKITDLDADTAAALASLDVDELWATDADGRRPVGQTKKVKLWNKTDNLTLLAKHLGLLKEQVEVTGQAAVVLLPMKAPSVEAWKEAHGDARALGAAAETTPAA